MTAQDVPGLADLLVKVGLPGDASLQPVYQSGNNRVFGVVAGAQRVCAKAYFTHPADKRDRRAAEWAFVSYAWSRGVRVVPEPLATDEEHDLAVYSWIDGRPVSAGEVDRDAIAQAAAFLSALNQGRASASSAALPIASEVAFSVAGHLAIIDGRVQRLWSALDNPADDVDATALAFVRAELLPAWSDVVAEAGTRAMRAGADPRQELPRSAGDWPPPTSAFTTHCGIRTAVSRSSTSSTRAGTIRRRPRAISCASLECRFRPRCTARRSTVCSRPPTCRRRPSGPLLLPAYRLKWVCIMLNEFLPVGLSRRRFADPDGVERRKVVQLTKARAALGGAGIRG